VTVITQEAYEKFEREFSERRNTTRTCSKCGAERQYGHGCVKCGAMMMDILEFGDAIRIMFEKMTPEEKERFRQETMRKVHYELAKTAWEKDNPGRPYDSEWKG